MMWAVSGTELKSLSIVGAVATACFSVAGFLAGCLVNILVSYGGSSTKLTDVGEFLFYKGTLFTGGLALLLFFGGVAATFSKASLLKQIKDETKAISQ